MAPAGTAPIKHEYLLSQQAQPVPDDDAAEGTTGSALARSSARDLPGTDGDGRTSGRSKRQLTKEQKKAQRGANKGRRFGKVRDEVDLCWKVANGTLCEFGDSCRFSHDITAYLAAKPRDLRVPSTSEALEKLFSQQEPVPEEHTSSVDPTTVCPIYAETGECRYGYKCRFFGGHSKADDTGNLVMANPDENKKAQAALTAHELNFVGPDIQKALRSRKYPFPVSDAYLKELREQEKKENAVPAPIPENAQVVTEPEQDGVMDVDSQPQQPTTPAPVAPSNNELIAKQTGAANLEAAKDTPDLQIRLAEKKRLHWSGKTYLAPLTTVGNLPFRRLCVKYGAEITCGEMGLATSFLAGSREEWSLVRRHPSESTFGVQVAGNKPANLVPTAEVLARELGGGGGGGGSGIDFVDLNCGCPIDLVFKAGSGSALLDAQGKLGKILVGMNKALGEIPVTVKLRTGVKEGKNNAHKIMPRISTEWGASCITLHGRTREQRYTKLADWNYIKECVEAVRAKEDEAGLHHVPIFGGGDCFSSQDYWERIDNTGVDGVMIGRGALIKPWIFTEIRERREWDISSRERLDLIRDYAEYGLNHFGSDTIGVNTTRRYLCEALSFQYRYVPIGILETLPGRINDRAPAFRGRDDLETLLASGNSQDWVKISEMFLGPAPEGWTFTPKHKSNAYGGEESQG
ncbi:hypothetical protein AX16_004715 [Volvariella volvacea WC 439]|nr:hypothetical protein AX16_004715 [Volvariella volvacea WC 439]